MHILKLKYFLLSLLIFSNSLFAQTIPNSNTTLIGHWPTGSCEAVVVRENLIYYGADKGFVIRDITDPQNPIDIGKVT